MRIQRWYYIIFGVLFTTLGAIPSASANVLPYIKITIPDAKNPDIARNGRVGFVRPTESGDNVWNFNGLKLKQVTNSAGFTFELEASSQRLAFSRVDFTVGADIYAYDDKKLRNLTDDNDTFLLDFDLSEENDIVWRAFVEDGGFSEHIFFHYCA